MILYGDDLICQAKSGMGKTAVFVLSVLHSLKVPGDAFQCLVLAPTRELAYQISKEFERLGKYITGLKIVTVYGGVNYEAHQLQIESSSPHVIVGTPGRTLELVTKGVIKLEGLTHFILDECDKLLENTDMRESIQKIFLKTKPKKQVMMFTATLNEKMREICLKFMKEVDSAELPHHLHQRPEATDPARSEAVLRRARGKDEEQDSLHPALQGALQPGHHLHREGRSGQVPQQAVDRDELPQHHGPFRDEPGAAVG